MKIGHLAALLASSLLLMGAGRPVTYDSGRDSESHGSGSAKGSYRVTIDRGKLKIRLDMEASKQGQSGGTRGYLVFTMLDHSNRIVWNRARSLSVGARFPQGHNKKNYSETFTLFGPPARNVLANGGSIAFNVSADVNPGSLTSLRRFTDSARSRIQDVSSVANSLSPGRKAALHGWVISKLGPAAAGL